MPTRLLDSDGATAGGLLTWIGLGFIKLWEVMTLENINNGLELLMVLGGLVFLVYKIVSIRLDNKIKRHNYKKLKDEEK